MSCDPCIFFTLSCFSSLPLCGSEQQALSQEVLEYQFIVDLTKQYSNVLGQHKIIMYVLLVYMYMSQCNDAFFVLCYCCVDVVCFLKSDSTSTQGDAMENDVMEDLSKPGAGGGGNNVLSGLALCLLEDRVFNVCVCVCVCE